MGGTYGAGMGGWKMTPRWGPPGPRIIWRTSSGGCTGRGGMALGLGAGTGAGRGRLAAMGSGGGPTRFPAVSEEERQTGRQSAGESGESEENFLALYLKGLLYIRVTRACSKHDMIHIININDNSH